MKIKEYVCTWGSVGSPKMPDNHPELIGMEFNNEEEMFRFLSSHLRSAHVHINPARPMIGHNIFF